MSVVIDANLAAAIVLPLPYSDLATQRITAWKKSGILLLAPVLIEYEIAAVLRKAVIARWLTTGGAIEAMDKIMALEVQCWPPTARLHQQALLWAQRLGHSKTYDAHYLALAEQEGSELWTADRRLANGAHQAGAHWVHLVGEGETRNKTAA